MSKQTYILCFCFRRRFRLAAAEAPPDVKLIFDHYSENGVMSADHIRRFLVEVQGEASAAVEEAHRIMDGLHELKHLHIFHRRGLTLEAFFKYLLGDVNSPLDPDLGIHHDMSAPLAHYFMYTSHNTYLTGNQLSSDSSDIPIIRALQGGVRGIELDLWPNSTKNNVDVLHGRTLTTPVEFIKCLRSIKEHAFTTSEYPVVITLEDHLTADLQALAAEMITQTFGDMLFSPGSEPMSEFPSPESLKRRVIISTKPPKEYLEAKKVEVKESNSEKDDDTDGEDMDNDEEDPTLQQVATDYGNLIAIPAVKRKGKLQGLLRNNLNSVKRLSLSEQVFEKAMTENGKDIVSFTQKNLLRVFPKAIRVDSSNFNPLKAWMHGTQMVALNMQGYGKSLWLMHGMFRANGGCGYIKKPEFLLNSGSNCEHFSPEAILPVKTNLKVTLYMGEGWYYDFSHTHFDYYSPPDLYAKIGIAGVPADKRKKKTKTMEDSWIPSWNEVFEFPLTAPELALLRIEVREYDVSGKGKLAGQTCLPVPELRQGIRAVPLYNRKGVKYKCVKLLLKFEFV